MELIYLIPMALCLYIFKCFLGIWSLNTLFPSYAIEYGFWQVFAMMSLIALFADSNIVEILKMIMIINQSL
jgi:hypothetical protein